MSNILKLICTMGKNTAIRNAKKAKYSAKEEKQGKKVIMWIAIVAIALAALMMIAFVHI